jgi:signal transduction histidine kinase
MLALVTGALILGSGSVVVPRLRQASRRARGSSPIGWLDALVETFVPSMGPQRAAEAERAKLAADLHATVVPELRRAIASAAATPAVAGQLRTALDDLETLMVERQSTVLDEFGLVAALEWLAERIQERTGAEVTLDVDAGDLASATESRPPRAIERAAFRSPARHRQRRPARPGRRIAMRVQARPAAVSLEVSDDGPGFDVEAMRVVAAERRGLTDMLNEAARIGARLAIDLSVTGGPAGTHVSFEWSAS